MRLLTYLRLKRLIATTALSWAFIGANALPAQAADSESLHQAAWDQNLDSCATVPAARYAFYAYRTLAVPNPEIYLQADQLFSDVVEDMPGSRLAYRTRDVHDLEFYLRLARREAKGGAFGWGAWSIVQDSIYDAPADVEHVAWLDRRLVPASVLLRAVSPHLSTLESAALRYCQLSRPPGGEKNIFLVIDKDGAGYLASDSTLWLAGLRERAVKDWHSIRPVLVFSEQSVYYPLFDRDDRATNPSLDSLVGRLGAATSPKLSGQEERRIKRIQEVASLHNESSRRLARLIASGLVDPKQPRVRDAWLEYAGADSALVSCGVLNLYESYFWANRLSPRAAEFAALLRGRTLRESLPIVQNRFLTLAGREVRTYDTATVVVQAWGVLWSYGLLETTLDDNVRTRAGSSFSQSTAMSAILDLAGVEHIQIGVCSGDQQVPDQEWILAGNGKHQFNFGVWTEVPDSAMGGHAPVLLSGFTLRGRPVRVGYGGFCSRIDDLAIADMLTRVVKLMPLADLAILSPSGENLPLSRFVMELVADRHHTSVPSWPAIQ